MDLRFLRDYCLQKPNTEETYPFDGQTAVFRVANKMFLLTNADQCVSINVKCDPQKALELREAYPDVVVGGFHQNKKHWNTIYLNQTMPNKEILAWIDHSYALVAPKKEDNKPQIKP